MIPGRFMPLLQRQLVARKIRRDRPLVHLFGAGVAPDRTQETKSLVAGPSERPIPSPHGHDVVAPFHAVEVPPPDATRLTSVTARHLAGSEAGQRRRGSSTSALAPPEVQRWQPKPWQPTDLHTPTSPSTASSIGAAAAADRDGQHDADHHHDTARQHGRARLPASDDEQRVRQEARNRTPSRDRQRARTRGVPQASSSTTIPRTCRRRLRSPRHQKVIARQGATPRRGPRPSSWSRPSRGCRRAADVRAATA